jgi:hypothetical protein
MEYVHAMAMTKGSVWLVTILNSHCHLDVVVSRA